MRRFLPALLGLACLGSMTVACFGSALFRGEQFAYRDAGHFYYPLYQRVQQEWRAGRWPLWEPEENGGMPLLGNPTAAVMYPGKLVFTSPIPYPWGMRLYVVGHVLLAVASMYAMTRSWGVGRTGSGLAALGYGFGMPVLFQYCNVVFLVGAAWMPLGLRGADRWLRLGRRRGLVELAIPLAMQTLGGDPQAAYLTALCAGGYALGLTDSGRGRARRIILAGALLLAAGASAAIGMSWAFRPGRAAPGPKLAERVFAAMPAARSWFVRSGRGPLVLTPTDLLGAASPWLRRGALVAWAVLGIAILVRVRGKGALLPRKLLGLGGACALALAISAVQLVPISEFAARSMRAAEAGAHDVYPFSLLPYQLVEFLWPSAFGPSLLGENRYWMGLLPGTGRHDVWVPSLYMGGLTLVLALGAAGFRGGPPFRAWMTGVAALTLLAALGEFAGPLWWARWGWEELGPHDPNPPRAIRLDGHLRDGDLGPYWFLATALPGFGSFRYPSKLLVPAGLALAALAGIGWDRVLAGRRRGAVAWAAIGLVLSGLAASGWLANRDRIVGTLRAQQDKSAHGAFGPIRPPGAFRETRRALIHGGAAFAASLLLILGTRRHPRFSGALALALTAADLTVANSRYVVTLPQSDLEAEPELLRSIRDAEARREHPTEGLDLYRIHRTPVWEPPGWSKTGSADRLREIFRWERGTLQPKYGLPLAVQYTLTEGTMELYDWWWFFAPFEPRLDAKGAEAFGGPVGRRIVYHPRRGYDLWNTRYFIVPAYPARWEDEFRSFASFLPGSTTLLPSPDRTRGPEGEAFLKRWIETADWQLLRNDRALPRAWVVHSARFLPPIEGLRKEDRTPVMMELLYEENLIWHEAGRAPIDPREKAWIEAEDVAPLLNFLRGGPPDPNETVLFRSYEPQRVEIEAHLRRPGVVVLADVFYPGWRLTIDGRPAPILRTNRMMRGAAVEAGTHRLVYTYRPDSFRIGALGSLGGLVALLALTGWSARGPDPPRPAGPGPDPDDVHRPESEISETMI